MKTNVTATYNSANIISFDGNQLTSTTYNDCSFLAIMYGQADLNRSSVCFINFKGGNTGSNTVTIAHPGAIYPSLSITSGGSVYALWSGDTSAKADVYITLLKLT